MRIFKAIILKKFVSHPWMQQFSIVGVIPDELDYSRKNLFLFFVPLENVLVYKIKAPPIPNCGYVWNEICKSGAIKETSVFICRSVEDIGKNILIVDENGKHRYHNTLCGGF
jgi:hypothetical protein